MKLNKIKALCLSNKRFNIIEGPDEVQWFTDNKSLWLCVGIHIGRRILPDLFGLKVEQCEKCFFREEEREGDEYGIAMADGEPELAYLGDVWEYEQRLMAFKSADGMLFVPRDYAEPCSITESTVFTIRIFADSDGKPYPMVAVYSGMICEALLHPISESYAEYIRQRMAMLGAIPTYRTEKGGENDEKVDKAG